MSEDEENPAVEKPTKRVFGIFKDPEPGFSNTVISVAANFVLTNMFLYGVTGTGRSAFLASIFTVPISVYLCVKDQQKDFDQWKEMKNLRLKGVPDRFMPYKCKYDWSDYEQRRMKAALAKSGGLSG